MAFKSYQHYSVITSALSMVNSKITSFEWKYSSSITLQLLWICQLKFSHSENSWQLCLVSISGRLSLAASSWVSDRLCFSMVLVICPQHFPDMVGPNTGEFRYGNEIQTIVLLPFLRRIFWRVFVQTFLSTQKSLGGNTVVLITFKML